MYVKYKIRCRIGLLKITCILVNCIDCNDFFYLFYIYFYCTHTNVRNFVNRTIQNDKTTHSIHRHSEIDPFEQVFVILNIDIFTFVCLNSSTTSVQSVTIFYE